MLDCCVQGQCHSQGYVSVNVSLVETNITSCESQDILWIAEPFVTKPSMVIHHFKPSVMCEKWVAIFKVKVTLTEFVFIQWNHDYFYYIFWTADFLATSLV